MNRELYAIWDKIAEDLAGSLIITRNVNEAVRLFTDLIQDNQTLAGRHPQDHDLRRLGKLTVDGTPLLVSDPELIITGEMVLATLRREDNA